MEVRRIIPLNNKEDYKKVIEELQTNNIMEYNPTYVLRKLHEKENLRKVFLTVIKNNRDGGGARISEVVQHSLLSKSTCYTQLFRLLELKLVERIYAMDILQGTIKNEAMKIKFLKWIESMPESLKRYYIAKTSYWTISEFGTQFACKSLDFEKEFRQNASKSMGEPEEDGI